MKKYNYTNKQGSVIVEAAVFLPVFLIAVITLSLLIRQVGFDETVFHTLVNQTRLLSVIEYSNGLAEDLRQNGVEEGVLKAKISVQGGSYAAAAHKSALYHQKIWEQLQDEINFPASLIYFGEDYSDGGHDHLIDAVVHYRITVPIPHAPRGELVSRRKLVVRAFVGNTKTAEPMTAEDMSTQKESCPVYVFPHFGERYHSASCSTVSVQPRLAILNNEIKKKFKPCDLCRAASLSNGSGVYCFQNYGDVYHRGNCRTIQKYVVQMEKEEAIQQGYTPCRKCAGIGGKE